jgi:Ni/Fe-hydrogenase subunit HybB-like protein
VLGPDRITFLFWIETLAFLAAAILFLRQGRRALPHQQLQAALLAMLGGTLYRVDTFLVAYDPGNGARYFPSIAEILITLGLIATETVIYVLVVRRFPILAGVTSPPRREAPAGLQQGVTP